VKAQPKRTEPNRTSDADARFQAFRQLVFRANSGDKQALANVQAMLKKPESAPLLVVLGDVAIAAQEDFINRIAGKNPVIQTAVGIQLERLRSDLAGPAPAPLEKLLVERVLMGWLQVHHADSTYARASNPSLAQGDYYQRNQNRAQARYLAAIKMLVTVRKLLQSPLSPLELATKTVSETTGKGGGIRRGGRTPAEGLAVEN